MIKFICEEKIFFCKLAFVYLFAVVDYFAVVFDWSYFLHLPELGEEGMKLLFSYILWKIEKFDGGKALEFDLSLDLLRKFIGLVLPVKVKQEE